MVGLVPRGKASFQLPSSAQMDERKARARGVALFLFKKSALQDKITMGKGRARNGKSSSAGRGGGLNDGKVPPMVLSDHNGDMDLPRFLAIRCCGNRWC